MPLRQIEVVNGRFAPEATEVMGCREMRQPSVTYLASIDQYSCITAKTYAVLTPNSIIPLTASRPPITCQGRCSVSPDAPSVAIESME